MRQRSLALCLNARKVKPAAVERGHGASRGGELAETEIEVVLRAADTAAHRTVVVKGEIDLLTPPALHDRLFDVIAASRRGDTIGIDLTEVQFFSAAGVRVLLDAHQAAQIRSVELYLVYKRNAVVRHVIAAVGIERFFVCV